jgi:hypothetical protein
VEAREISAVSKQGTAAEEGAALARANRVTRRNVERAEADFAMRLENLTQRRWRAGL